MYSNGEILELAYGLPNNSDQILPNSSIEIPTSLFYSWNHGEDAGGREIELFCKDVPPSWEVGGKVSGTITCPWVDYKGTWELQPTSYAGLAYTSGGSSPIASGTYTITILPTDLSAKSYAANDGEKEFTAKTSSGTTAKVKLLLKSTMQSSSKIQMKKNEGKISNVTDLGSISSITIINASNITSTFSVGSGDFSIDAGSKVGSCDKIEIVFTI